MYSAQASSAKLALTRWLVGRQWQAFIDEKSRPKLDGSFKRFFDIHLSTARPSCKRPSSVRWVTATQISSRSLRVRRILFAYWPGVYSDAQTQPWLENWRGCVTPLLPVSASELSITEKKRSRRCLSGWIAGNNRLATDTPP